MQPTAEQIRIAQILEFKNGNLDPTREKVTQLMEMTERSEEDACMALHECDNDVEQAVIFLLENLEIGSLVTNAKKKKNKSAQDGNGDGEEFESSNNNRETSRGDYERKGARGSNRGGSGANRGRSRGGGARDGRDNGENREDRGKPRGRGGFSNRGGRGRGTGGRGGRERNFRPQEQPQEIDNWDPASTQIDTNNKNDESWGNCVGDWDNEEYTGSLAETKVFTPSTQQDISAPPGLEQQILQPPSSDYSTVTNSATGQYGELHSGSTAAQQLRQALEMPSLGQQSSVPLSAEQSQYFNTLGSQNSGAAAAYQSSVQYNYNDQQAPRSQQQQNSVIFWHIYHDEFSKEFYIFFLYKNSKELELAFLLLRKFHRQLSKCQMWICLRIWMYNLADLTLERVLKSRMRLINSLKELINRLVMTIRKEVAL